MTPAQLPPDEARRIEALRQYALFDTLPEKALDDLTSLAAQICGTPMAMISLVGKDRQWFKSRIGLEISGSTRDVSFAAHALNHRGLFIVPDATKDERFADNPMVTGILDVRFYAGVTLITSENVALGTLCVIDRVPRQLTPEQEKALETLGRQVMTHIELRRHTGALKLSEERFTNAFEHAPIGMTLVSIEGRFLKVNAALCNLIGYSPEELAGKTFQDITYPDDLAMDLENVEELLAGKTNAYHMEKRYFHKNGHLVWVQLGVSLVTDKQGKPLYFISQIQDVTAKRETMERQKELTQKAQAAERAKSEFLAVMSHEIRTPLNGIIGMASILADTKLDEMQRDCVDTIDTSGESLLAVINDILDFSKVESGKMTLEHRAFNLQKCIEEAMDLFAAQIRAKGLEAVYLIAPNIPLGLTGDALRLRQILINLIGNAIKFTTRGGEIVLNVDLHEKTDESYHLLFSVKDTGIGIAPDGLDKLFRAFQQGDTSTTRKFGGTGLGLAISRRLTELMGGQMWAESEVGKGSTFHFTAIFDGAEAGTISVPSMSRTGQIKTLSVLIVDDNKMARHVLESQLTTWRMLSASASTAREALKVLAERRFDLVLIDSQLPDIDGITFAREIRKTSQVPLVLLSNSREISGEDARLFQAQLLKPIKHSQLFPLILKLTGAKQSDAPTTAGKRFDNALGTERPLRILLTEDNLINQKVGIRMLGQFGYTANLAGNGKQAYEAALHSTYDLILMDIQMPEMDGIESSRRIRAALGKACPVIVALTAEALEGDEKRFLDLGFDAYLSKPLQVAKLQQILATVEPQAGA